MKCLTEVGDGKFIAVPVFVGSLAVTPMASPCLAVLNACFCGSAVITIGEGKGCDSARVGSIKGRGQGSGWSRSS